MDKATEDRVIKALLAGATPQEAMPLVRGISDSIKAKEIRRISLDLIASGRLDPTKGAIPDISGTRQVLYCDVFDEMSKLLGIARELKPKIQPPPVDGRQRTIVIGDLHFPNHSEPFLADLTAEYGKGNRLVIAGDLCDFIMLSKHEKYYSKSHKNKEVDQTPLDVMAGLQATLAALAEEWDDIEVCFGNHDTRLVKSLIKALDTKFGCQISEVLWKHVAFDEIPNLITRPTELGKGFIMERGDTVIGHFDISSKVEMKAACKIADWVRDNPKFKHINLHCAVQAHTHQVGDAVHNGIRVVECGTAMGESPDYVTEQAPNFRYPNMGFFELVQYDGVISNRESRLHLVNSNDYWDTGHIERFLKEAA